MREVAVLQERCRTLPIPVRSSWTSVCSPCNAGVRALAENPAVSLPNITGVIYGASAAIAEMALRRARVLGRSPESWLVMRRDYDPWQARKVMNR